MFAKTVPETDFARFYWPLKYQKRTLCHLKQCGRATFRFPANSVKWIVLYSLEGNFMMRRQSLLLVVLCLLPYLTYAQSTESDEKEKAQNARPLSSKTLADIGNLKLPENRALFYSEAGNAIWQDDQKRARSLFPNRRKRIDRGPGARRVKTIDKSL